MVDFWFSSLDDGNKQLMEKRAILAQLEQTNILTFDCAVYTWAVARCRMVCKACLCICLSVPCDAHGCEVESRLFVSGSSIKGEGVQKGDDKM